MVKLGFLLIVIMISTGVVAQTSLTGVVLSNKDNTPVELASVYINGSSVGTTSGKDGHFTLNRITFPCLLVVSHLSYRLKTILLDKVPTTSLVVALDERAKEIVEISVSGKNLRKENEAMFKKYFLYGDENANMVKFQNLDVLYFSKGIDTTTSSITNLHLMAEALGRHYDRTEDNLSVFIYRDKFSAKTTSPLIISIENMGYRVAMDIDYFNVTTPKTRIERMDGIGVNSNCYSYSLPIKPTSEKEEKKYESNRRKAYFNSVRHFFRSLFTNSLEENGFLIPEFTPPRKPKYKTSYSSTGEFRNEVVGWEEIKYDDSFLDLTPYLVQKTDTEIEIVGLKGKTFQILYFCKNNNEPINLNNYKTFQSGYFDQRNTSYITFKEDTCRIYSNGKSDKGILIAGKMAIKPIGTLILPDDYEPKSN